MLIGIHHGILRFIEDADGFQAIEAMARRKNGPVYRLGAEELPHPGEVDFHQLRLQPNRLPIQRQGLPYIHLLRQPGQGVEIDGELEPVRIAGLLQERLGLAGVVPVEVLEALIPRRVLDPRPEGSTQLGVVPWGVATFDEMTQSEAVGTLVLTNTPVMEKEPVMTASDVGYDHIHTWIKSILGPVHATVRVTVAWALLCLLLAQRATPAALARALPAEQAGSGRACVRRVRRWWCGPPLEQVYISSRLIHTALTVLPPGTPVVVALDTTRLGPWEVWLAGIVVAGRTLPIGWAVIPYPWPKGRFRSTTLALIQQLQRAFPTGVRWTLVADRGFPSAALFAQLRQGGTDFSVRLRLSDWVTVGKVYAMVVDH